MDDNQDNDAVDKTSNQEDSPRYYKGVKLHSSMTDLDIARVIAYDRWVFVDKFERIYHRIEGIVFFGIYCLVALVKLILVLLGNESIVIHEVGAILGYLCILMVWLIFMVTLGTPQVKAKPIMPAIDATGAFTFAVTLCHLFGSEYIWQHGEYWYIAMFVVSNLMIILSVIAMITTSSKYKRLLK
ncbi:MAG: hypothetical protein LBK70_03450 [Clostridiales bacterium]|nr:hypothetical protein [Clostridiales bacterium]